MLFCLSVVTPGRHISRRLSLGIAALVSLAVMAAGCGGRSAGGHVAQLGTSPTQSSSRNGGSTHDQALAYARCMRSNGVPHYPDPSGSGDLRKGSAQAFGVS
ncbi:MAG: hypothetical protein ACRDQZ_22640, partial [Mycobacteriales bacterium]